MNPVERMIIQKIVELSQSEVFQYVSIQLFCSLIIYWVIKTFIVNFFDKALESFKLKQAKLLEDHRHELNKRFNRVSRFHEKEFEVMTEIWLKIQNSFNKFKNEIEENRVFDQKLNCDNSNEPERSFRELCEYFRANKVLVDDELSELLTRLEKELNDVQSRRNLPGNNSLRYKAGMNERLNKISVLIDEIGNEIQKTLKSGQA